MFGWIMNKIENEVRRKNEDKISEIVLSSEKQRAEIKDKHNKTIELIEKNIADIETQAREKLINIKNEKERLVKEHEDSLKSLNDQLTRKAEETNTEFEHIKEKMLSDHKEKISSLEKDLKVSYEKMLFQKNMYDHEELELKTKRDQDKQDYLELKASYAQKSNDLREQIKVLEAKASPDQVWITAFNTGVSKAWDMIKDTYSVVNDDVVKGLVKETESKTLTSVNEIVKDRVSKLENKTMKSIVLITEKIKDFEVKKLNADRVNDKENVKKYENYLMLLNWVVDNEKTD